MFGMPVWHHHHSSKLSVFVSDQPPAVQVKTLILKSNAVEVRIYPHPQEKGWIIEYEILHSPDSWSKGRVRMSTDDIKTAFGLSDSCEEMWGQEILWAHGGDVAHQGKYIRYRNFLNIPGPGTGHDRDANLSVFVSKEVKSAVALLLQ
jgi:hypothetical protein